MKTLSVGQMKGGRGPRYNSSPPREGTAYRKYYDLFMMNKGKIVEVPFVIGWDRIYNALRDYYGLDIRFMGKVRKYCLVGEWFGSKYVDYVAQRFV